MPFSPRRPHATRRFSSSSIGAAWNNKLSSAPSTLPRGRRLRRTSSVGRYTPIPFDDGSEIEEHAVFSRSGGSDPSPDGSFSVELVPRPMIYASLPPSPISSPTDVGMRVPEFSASTTIYEPPFSLWDYLREELLATDFDSHQELKWERVSNFLNIPLAMEKVSFLLHFHIVIQIYPPVDNWLWLCTLP